MFKRTSFFIVVRGIVMAAVMSPFAANAALFGGDGNSGALVKIPRATINNVTLSTV
jgi:hypothetical protein